MLHADELVRSSGGVCPDTERCEGVVVLGQRGWEDEEHVGVVGGCEKAAQIIVGHYPGSLGIVGGKLQVA